MSRIVLMDGYSILRKAYYSVPVRTDLTGSHTNAVAGFLNILLKITEKEKPEYLSVLFGAEESTEKMSEGLRGQISLLKEVLSAMKIHMLEREEAASDDLIGTVAGHLQKDIVVVSGERDLLQLASERIRLCILETGDGQSVLKDYTASDVEAAYKITPAQLAALKILIKVVKIGERTACDLMDTYGSIENIYTHLEELPQKSIREKMADKNADAESCKDLYVIDTDARIDFPEHLMKEMKLESEGSVSFTPEADAKLKKLSLGSFFEQPAQAGRKPMIDIDKDIKVITVRTAEDVQTVFDTAAKAGSAAVRLVHIRAKGAGELGAHADGQMYLQMDAEEEVFGCILCGGSSDETNIHYIESGSAISESFLKQQIEKLLLSGKMSVSVFDVKNDYGDMISEKNDRNISSDVLTRQLVDCKIAAYLINPLKNDYEIADIAEDRKSVV